eukprot:3454798-Pleurochrysis_carterae.AAC.6
MQIQIVRFKRLQIWRSVRFSLSSKAFLYGYLKLRTRNFKKTALLTFLREHVASLGPSTQNILLLSCAENERGRSTSTTRSRQEDETHTCSRQTVQLFPLHATGFKTRAFWYCWQVFKLMHTMYPSRRLGADLKDLKFRECMRCPDNSK